jgi:endogenous inhibitor of DNA gyrase (YacG/DUF329 family)
MADLGRWLSEDYRVPDSAPPDGPEAVGNGLPSHDDDVDE